VSDDTVPQFGRSLRDDASRAPIAGASRPTSCPTCGSHFSPDGRFCPFDGSALVPAEGWDPSADALLGALVDGRYEVLAVLGEGGMGTVYEVKHRALGKRFALKALRKDLTADGEIAARFIQEARTAAAVSHPGLVEITDFGRLESGQVYFVMELLEGQSLAALLRTGGPLPAARGLDIVRQLVHALKAAHDASIVHRDLKPDNIHVGRGDAERDLVKIVDFGLAKVIGSSKLTRAGMVFGTPHYMSPEQAAGEVVDHRADIYALGIVMYEMFTGKVPFEADSYMGVLTKHMYMEPAPPSQVSAELKELGSLEHVILRCLQKRPSARYDNLAALLVDLEQHAPRPGRQVRAVQPLALAEQLELPSAREGTRQRAFAHWPLVIVACAFACGIALVLLLRRPGPGLSGAAPPTTASSTRGEPTPAKAGGTPSSAATVDAPAGPASAGGSAAPVASAPLPARKPARPTSNPPKRAAGAASKRPAGFGDIVDPWAR
jgi:eukaryotic-like serine/threonine-protein kinase